MPYNSSCLTDELDLRGEGSAAQGQCAVGAYISNVVLQTLADLPQAYLGGVQLLVGKLA